MNPDELIIEEPLHFVGHASKPDTKYKSVFVRCSNVVISDFLHKNLEYSCSVSFREPTIRTVLAFGGLGFGPFQHKFIYTMTRPHMGSLMLPSLDEDFIKHLALKSRGADMGMDYITTSYELLYGLQADWPSVIRHHILVALEWRILEVCEGREQLYKASTWLLESLEDEMADADAVAAGYEG